MKKIIAVTMLVLAVSTIASAQRAYRYPHHELYAGVGLYNSNQAFSLVGDFLGTILTLGTAVEPGKYWLLTPSIGYRYWFNKSFGIGAHLAFDKNSVEALHDNGGTVTTEDDQWLTHDRYYYTIAVDINWNYLHRPLCQLYGNFGAAVTMVSFSDNNTEIQDAKLKQFPFPNFHLSLFGVRVGKTLAAFAELGWGYKGILNAGLSVKF